MAVHFWPPAAITALPFNENYSSDFVTAIAEEEDPDNPFPVFHGGNRVYYTIVGDGREVAFWAIGSMQGVTLTLADESKPDLGDGMWKIVALDATQGRYETSDPLFYRPTTGLRWWLAAGQTYWLEVGSAGVDGGARGYGQDIELYAFAADPLIGDLRDDAIDVIIGVDGDAYLSGPVLNTGYSSSALGQFDDPYGNDLLSTAWWRYTPARDTDLTVALTIGPDSNFPDATLAVYTESGDPEVANPLLGYARYDGGYAAYCTVPAEQEVFIQVGLLPPDGFLRSPAQYYNLTVSGSASVDHPTPEGVSWDDPAALAPDPFRPLILVPAKGSTGPSATTQSSTLLDEVRAFSSAVRRAVRLTSASSIQMVDPSVPIPTGWRNAEASAMYSQTTRSAKAETSVLSVSAGDVQLSAAAQIISDDVRLITSNWRIPDRLPFPDMPAGAVQRVTYTFSPAGFTAALDFHYPAVPLIARRH